MLNKLLVLFFLGTPLIVFSQDTTTESEYDNWVISQSAPPQLWDMFIESGLDSVYNVNVTRVNPFYYMGDFDGDDTTDFAVILTDMEEDSDNLAILGGNGEVYWLEQDEELAFPTLTAWYLYPKYWEVERGADEADVPELIGDALMIIKVESSSALIYWNGKRFVSYWQGD